MKSHHAQFNYQKSLMNAGILFLTVLNVSVWCAREALTPTVENQEPHSANKYQNFLENNGSHPFDHSIEFS